MSRKLLIENEQIVTSMRTHIKVLFIPFLILTATSAAAGFLYAATGDAAGGTVGWIVLAIAAAVIVVGVLVPFIRWLTWTFTITNKRLVEQKGILTRTGRVIPLSRINDVSFEKNLNDRILGCGTLVVHDASEQAGLRLRDIPKIEAVHRTLSMLVFDIDRTDSQAGNESI
ncbi:MAG: PH domain-containing protein [Propionibacteriales bacterium]|nr:PH domain-containing protein [Propionibacteriales bacterium]